MGNWHSVSKRVEHLIEMVKGKNFRTYLIFFCISFLIWSIEKMRQNYTVDMDFHINCINVPDDYVVDDDNIETMRTQVSGDGLSIMFVPSEKKRSIDVDVSLLRRTFINGQAMAIILPRKFTHEIVQLLPDQLSLEHIELDTIYVPLLTKVRRQLSVVVCDNITLESQHMFSGPRTVSPDSVWVYGTNDKVDTMTAVYTKPLPPAVLHDSITFRHEFNLPHGVEASALGVEVGYCVETYTEKVMSVPVTAVNIPSGYTFKAFPQMVNVVMSVALSKFDVISPNDIDVIADLQDVKPGDNQSRIKVRLTSYPDYIRSISYSPIFVEYLLEKRHVKHYNSEE